MAEVAIFFQMCFSHPFSKFRAGSAPPRISSCGGWRAPPPDIYITLRGLSVLKNCISNCIFARKSQHPMHITSLVKYCCRRKKEKRRSLQNSSKVFFWCRLLLLYAQYSHFLVISVTGAWCGILPWTCVDY
jgi:hypothetical protein